MKLPYNLVFILFGISAIFSTNSTSNSGIRSSQSNNLGILVNLLISMFNAYDTIKFYIYYNHNISFITSNIIANVIFTILRFKLSKRLNKLKRISKFISRFEIKEGKVWKSCFYFWMVLS